MQTPTCPKCDNTMAPGFVIDKGVPGGSVSSPEWAEGTPQHSFWTGLNLSGRERHAVLAYRCPECGFLESYAPQA